MLGSTKGIASIIRFAGTAIIVVSAAWSVYFSFLPAAEAEDDL